MADNKCVCCGEIIPEGMIACPNCLVVSKKKTELKPCPFCGRKPSKVRKHHCPSISTVFYTVECKEKGSKCGVNPKTRFHYTEEAAIEAWNRRAEDANQTKA